MKYFIQPKAKDIICSKEWDLCVGLKYFWRSTFYETLGENMYYCTIFT